MMEYNHSYKMVQNLSFQTVVAEMSSLKMRY